MVMIGIPIMFVAAALFQDSEGVWSHLVATRLFDYVAYSFVLVLGVTTVAVILGVVGAWLVTAYQFPGRSWFVWLLLLPMAMPAYVAGYAYTDFFEFAGPVQVALRELFNLDPSTQVLPAIRSLGGAVMVMALVLFPYVYLTTRAALLAQGSSVFETAASLGCGPWRRFWLVAVPLARPAIAAGASLVAMETLTDYGTVDYFAIDTFTTGIYRTWHGFYSYAAACKLAAILLFMVAALLAVERIVRGRRQYFRSGQRQQQRARVCLHGWRSVLACSACGLPVAAGFVVPLAILLGRSQWSAAMWERMQGPLVASLTLALITALLGVAVAVGLAYSRRLWPHPLSRLGLRVAGLGYAIPGSVVAVAIIVPFAWLDREIISPFMTWLIATPTQLWLSGSYVILIFAYLVRFLAVGLGPVEHSLATISQSQFAAPRDLGHGPLQSLRRVHIPLMRSGVVTAALLIMVDVLKELPATMIVRPFDVRTLAIAVHDQVSQESLALAAAPALLIVLAGLGPVLLLTRSMQRRAHDLTIEVPTES